MFTSKKHSCNILLLALLTLAGCSTRNDPTTSQSPTPQSISDGCEVTYRDTSLFANYISGNWQASNNLQKLIIASDTQAFRYLDSSGNDQISESSWNRVMGSITSLLKVERNGDKYVPLIINGDITDYGHGNERKSFRSQITKSPSSTPGPLFLPGLGNHDYDQNVGNCANNGCARDAVCDHIMWTKTIQNSGSAVNFDHTFAGETHTGSLAYSFDIGNIHVIQLNNEPTYTNYFETGGSTAVGAKRKFNITSSMAWLEKDLIAAKSRGKYTIINLHKINQWENESVRLGKFTQLIQDKKVIAIFAGHYHKLLGKYGNFGKIPSFQSGALMGKTYIRLLYNHNERAVQVNWYHGPTERGEYKYNADTYIPIAPPIGAPKAILTYYKGKNFMGASCTVELLPGAVKKINSACPGYGSQAGTSFKIRGFGDGKKLHQFCLAIPYFGGNRCYIGTYKGDFEVPDLTPLAKLPIGLLETRLGNDNGYENFTYQDYDSRAEAQAD
ncbi:metallophosphoesterase [Pseudomonas sp. NPDC089392]|uniref:metallophosphoesterase n=1 Tax=Pseudomonas sp. NPDC089392 TaxID=3364459 RepID=UPI003830D060